MIICIINILLIFLVNYIVTAWRQTNFIYQFSRLITLPLPAYSPTISIKISWKISISNVEFLIKQSSASVSKEHVSSTFSPSSPNYIVFLVTATPPSESITSISSITWTPSIKFSETSALNQLSYWYLYLLYLHIPSEPLNAIIMHLPIHSDINLDRTNAVKQPVWTKRLIYLNLTLTLINSNDFNHASTPRV